MASGIGCQGLSARRMFWVLVAASSAACSGDAAEAPSGVGGSGGSAEGTSGDTNPSSTTAAGGSAGTGVSAGQSGGAPGDSGGAPASGAGGNGTAGGDADGGAAGEADSGAGGEDGGAGGTAESGAAGEAGSATVGAGETVAGDACTFTVKHTTSSAIGTVEIVTWSTDLTNVTEANIEFGLAGIEPTMTAPVDLEEPDYRTLLLGMKGDRSYGFRIVASSDETICKSPEFSFTTGSVPDWVPVITKGVSSAGESKGFIVTTPGVDLSHQHQPRDLPNAYIFDTDGDVVWWVPEVLFDTTRAHISWDSKWMWVMWLNLDSPSGGRVFKVSMDGMVMDELEGLGAAHHDFTALPGGGIATMLNGVNDTPDSFVEVKANGTIETVVADLATLYEVDSFHPNAVHYNPADDSYTLSDLMLDGFVKFKRNGELVWQLGGDNPKGNSFTLVDVEPWADNHGHHLTADGRFLFFSNNVVGSTPPPARVIEVLLDETNWTAKKNWEYQDADLTSYQLGDVQRLPNGNALVTYSMRGVMQEVTPSGKVVQSFDNSHSWDTRSRSEGYALFGYADFRTSLYGPPLR